jgi:hypothetical protein
MSTFCVVLRNTPRFWTCLNVEVPAALSASVLPRFAKSSTHASVRYMCTLWLQSARDETAVRCIGGSYTPSGEQKRGSDARVRAAKQDRTFCASCKVRSLLMIEDTLRDAKSAVAYQIMHCCIDTIQPGLFHHSTPLSCSQSQGDKATKALPRKLFRVKRGHVVRSATCDRRLKADDYEVTLHIFPFDFSQLVWYSAS